MKDFGLPHSRMQNNMSTPFSGFKCCLLIAFQKPFEHVLVVWKTISYLCMGILELYYTKKNVYRYPDNRTVLLWPLYNLLYNVKSGVYRGYFSFLILSMRGF